MELKYIEYSDEPITFKNESRNPLFCMHSLISKSHFEKEKEK